MKVSIDIRPPFVYSIALLIVVILIYIGIRPALIRKPLSTARPSNLPPSDGAASTAGNSAAMR